MNAEQPAASGLPGAQYLSAEYVIDEFGTQGAHRLCTPTTPKVLVLGILAGAFITTGALFSALLAAGRDSPGVERLLEEFGFPRASSSSSCPVPLCSPEANVVMPATARRHQPGISATRIVGLWGVVGNFVGALLVGYALAPPSVDASGRGPGPAAGGTRPG